MEIQSLNVNNDRNHNPNMPHFDKICPILDRLVQLVQDPVDDIRQAATTALVRVMGSIPKMKFLKQATIDTLLLLARQRPHYIFPVLQQLCEIPHLGRDMVEHKIVSKLEPFLSPQHEDTGVIEAAIQFLHRLWLHEELRQRLYQQKILLCLVPLSNHPNTRICCTVVRWLKKLSEDTELHQPIADSGAIPSLLKLVDHAHDTVRNEAIDILDNISKNEYVQALIAPQTVQSTVANDEDIGAIDWLIHQLAIEHSRILYRRQSHQSLSGLPLFMGFLATESKPFIEILSTPQPDHRKHLLGIIERIIQPMANRAWIKRVVGVAHIMPLLHDPDQSIRDTVFKVIQQLLKMGGTASPQETLRLMGDCLSSDYVDVRLKIVTCIHELAEEVTNHSLLMEAMVVDHLVVCLRDIDDDICSFAAASLEKLSSMNDEYAMRVSTSVALVNMTLRNDPVEMAAMSELMEMVVQEEERLERLSREMTTF